MFGYYDVNVLGPLEHFAKNMPIHTHHGCVGLSKIPEIIVCAQAEGGGID